jgi:hypothetical protein
VPLVGLFIVVSLALAGLAGASANAPPPLVSFSHLPAGWRAFSGDNGAYALSWRYRPDRYGWAPSMPKNGIAVNVFFPITKTAHYPPLRLVLPKAPATNLKAAPDTPEYRIHGRVSGRDVEVWVDIRRLHPTKPQLRVAQRVVAAIRFR